MAISRLIELESMGSLLKWFSFNLHFVSFSSLETVWTSNLKVPEKILLMFFSHQLTDNATNPFSPAQLPSSPVPCQTETGSRIYQDSRLCFANAAICPFFKFISLTKFIMLTGNSRQREERSHGQLLLQSNLPLTSLHFCFGFAGLLR